MRDVRRLSVAALAWGFMAAAPLGHAQNDLWGPTNEVSAVRGPADLNRPAESSAVHIPGDSKNWRALCDAHLHDLARTDADKYQRTFGRGSTLTTAQRDAEWQTYWQSRNATGRQCKASFPDYAWNPDMERSAVQPTQAGSGNGPSRDSRLNEILTRDSDANRYYRSCGEWNAIQRSRADEWGRVAQSRGYSKAHSEGVRQLASLLMTLGVALVTNFIPPASIAIAGLTVMKPAIANPDPYELEQFKVAAGQFRNQCEMYVVSIGKVDPELAARLKPRMEEIRRAADQALLY